jgi:sec-independent protein translocase protein TatA
MELFSPSHLIVVAIVALVLFFGWKQLPDMARSLGRSMRIFRTEIKGMTEDDKARSDAAQTPSETAAIEPAPAPRALPHAEVVHRSAAPSNGAAVQSNGAAPEASDRPRPRPTPQGS